MTILKHGFIWNWNGSLTVNVSDGFNDVYCYTLSDPTFPEFQNSIDEVLEFVKESAIHTYN